MREVHVNVWYLFHGRLFVGLPVFMRVLIMNCLYQLLVLGHRFIMLWFRLLFDRLRVGNVPRTRQIALAYAYDTGVRSKFLLQLIDLASQTKQLWLHKLALHLEALLVLARSQGLLRRSVWGDLSIQDFSPLVVEGSDACCLMVLLWWDDAQVQSRGACCSRVLYLHGR